jgi:hypothetical protein
MRIISVISTIVLVGIAQSVSFAQGMVAADPTLNANKVSWLERRIDLGEIPQGVAVMREYHLKNISKDTLLLQTVKSGCHCTTVKWKEAPIAPGESATIQATFDAEKEGPFYKIITVTTNFDPNTPVAFTLTGTVLPKPAKN